MFMFKVIWFVTEILVEQFYKAVLLLNTLSKHKFKFNIRASLLDILEAGDTYYEVDEIILKMKKAEPIFL